MNVFVSKLMFVVVFIALILLSIGIGIRIFFISIPFLIAYLLSKPLSKFTKFLHKMIPLPYGIITFLVVFVFVTVFFSSVSFLIYRTAISISGLSQYMSSVSDLIQDFSHTFDGVKINLPWFDAQIGRAHV